MEGGENEKNTTDAHFEPERPVSVVKSGGGKRYKSKSVPCDLEDDREPYDRRHCAVAFY
jgi:hypothetical protein